MASSNEENMASSRFGCHWLPCKTLVQFARKTKKLGKDDPRRIMHSIKVALALSLVSIFYYFKPTYNDFGANAIWAVLTVIFVFEFSVGATLGKGLNRMLATLLAAALGIGAHQFALFFGKNVEPILLSVLVFVVAVSFTFVRFFPGMKLKYDFGLMVFILTFCLVTILSYRQQLISIALKRLVTVVIGSCAAIMVCIFIFPVWIGEDFHKLVALNLERVGNFLEGFSAEYFSVSQEGIHPQRKRFLEKYKSVLTSKGIEENMASLASWEPRHGKFLFRHPWKQYQKVGDLTRECAYKLETLNTFLNTEKQISFHIRGRIKDPCTMISLETGKALQELASSIREMVQSTSADCHIANSKTAAEDLKALFKPGLWEGVEVVETISAIAVVSMLLDVVICTERIAEAVHKLASLANFENAKGAEIRSRSFSRSTIQPMSSADLKDNHVVTIVE